MGEWYWIGLALGHRRRRSASCWRASSRARALGVAARAARGGGGRARRRPARAALERGRRGRDRRPRSARSARPRSSSGRCGAAAPAAARPRSSASPASCSPRSRSSRASATSRRSPSRCSRLRAAPALGRALRRAAHPRPRLMAKPLILVVVDGLTPAALEDALEGDAVAGAALPRRARHARPRRLDLPVADARLPLLDRDRRAPRRARDPAPRLVPPRRAADRRVRLLVRRHPRGRDDPVDPRHDLLDEPRAPRRPTR